MSDTDTCTVPLPPVGAVWLELSGDALRWLADGHEDWWTTTAGGEPDVDVQRFAAGTGCPRTSVYRLREHLGGRAFISVETVAWLIRAGSVLRGVSEAEAYERLFGTADAGNVTALPTRGPARLRAVA